MLGELHSSLNTYASAINESTNSLYLNREPNRAEFTGKGNPLMDHCVTEMNVPNVTLYINFFTSSYTHYRYTHICHICTYINTHASNPQVQKGVKHYFVQFKCCCTACKCSQVHTYSTVGSVTQVVAECDTTQQEREVFALNFPCIGNAM